AKEAKALESFVDNAAQARFIADALREAQENGQLVLQWTRLQHCSYSGKSAGYAKHKRSGKYHRKGDTDFRKPLTMAGVELASRFLRLQGYASLGCCAEFWDAVRPKLAARLEDVRAEISKEITGHPPKWKRFNRMRCMACGWVGHEGQMGKLPCLMRGEYPGVCPGCGARNEVFGKRAVEFDKGFEVVPAKQERE
ncbi:MAG: hypothetical protein AB1512_32955, partial [Thermodesulfobacteriota bacterium]